MGKWSVWVCKGQAGGAWGVGRASAGQKRDTARPPPPTAAVASQMLAPPPLSWCALHTCIPHTFKFETFPTLHLPSPTPPPPHPTHRRVVPQLHGQRVWPPRVDRLPPRRHLVSLAVFLSLLLAWCTSTPSEPGFLGFLSCEPGVLLPWVTTPAHAIWRHVPYPAP